MATLNLPIEIKVHHEAHLDEEARQALADIVDQIAVLAESVTYRFDRIDHALRRVMHALEITLNLEEHQMADLSAITAEIAQNTDVVVSAITLLSNLSTQIRELSTDPAALQALADQIDANNSALAEAVAANTPAAPAPPA